MASREDRDRALFLVSRMSWLGDLSRLRTCIDAVNIDGVIGRLTAVARMRVLLRTFPVSMSPRLDVAEPRERIRGVRTAPYW